MMLQAITVDRFALLLGMSLFLGFAFEQYDKRETDRPPGGIRTFPLLAMLGGTLWSLGANSHLGFVLGALGVAGWMAVFYARRLATRSDGPMRGELVVPTTNLLAYTLGALAFAQPPWVSVAVAVVAALLLASRERLHALADTVILDEVFTGGQFLLLVGVALPLLPDTPIPWLGTISPQRMLLAVVVISALSYGSYLVQRYVKPRGGVIVAAILGGLYSSTATTVVLARRARDAKDVRDERIGIVLASALMYVRLLIVVAVLNLALARVMAVPLLLLFLVTLALAGGIALLCGRSDATEPSEFTGHNPLHLGTAAIFAILFVLVTLASSWAARTYGHIGIDVVAGIVGVTDIDPFVLSLAQGNVANLSLVGAGSAILVAAASNDLLKGLYAVLFGGRKQWLPALALAVAMLATLGAAFGLGDGL